MRRTIAFGLLLMCALVAAASERAVVAKRFSGMTLRDHEVFTFLPGEVVTVQQRGESQSLAESYPRSWATTGGVWVPNEILVQVRSFEKIQHWTGDREINVGGGDYDARYKFDLTGAFTATFSDGHEESKSYGHLYRSKTVIWAKINGWKGPQPGQEQIFLLMPDGKLCFPYDACKPAP
jgi:hypothetical protein